VTTLVIAGGLTPTNIALCKACDEIGIRSRLLPPELLAARIAAGDIVLGRLDVLPTIDRVEPGLDALCRLEEDGIRILNPPRALTNAHDKLETALALSARELPHPTTVHVRDEQSREVHFGGPYVVKPRFGSWGKDVTRCHSIRELRETVAEFRRRPWFQHGGALVQKLLPNRGVDLRILVAGGIVIGAIERVAAAGEWRTNIALGGQRRPVIPPGDACALAIAAVNATKLDLAGVDLLPLPAGGYSVLEVNGCVDFTMDYGSENDDPFRAAIVSLVYPAMHELRRLAAPSEGLELGAPAL